MNTAQAIKESLYAMQITPPAILLQLFTRLVISKRFEEIRRLRMEDVRIRNQIFDEIMPDQITCGNQYCPIRWLTLPDNYTSDEFEKIALSENLQIYGAGRFTIGTSVIPNAIRISLLSAQPIELYQEGLKKLHALLTK
jgi:DNA-binding transcriptional MocR family regulator